jgi:hypothetical protein
VTAKAVTMSHLMLGVTISVLAGGYAKRHAWDYVRSGPQGCQKMSQQMFRNETESVVPLQSAVQPSFNKQMGCLLVSGDPILCYAVLCCVVLQAC